MSAPVPHDPDVLLDYAYGELAPANARALELHLQGCEACSRSLASIKSVRQTMAKLPSEAVPEAGLESLLAYAGQSARRAQSGDSALPRKWSALFAPLAGALALGLLVVVGVEVSKSTELKRFPQHEQEEAAATPERPAEISPAPEAAAPSPPDIAGADRAPAPKTSVAKKRAAEPAPSSEAAGSEGGFASSSSGAGFGRAADSALPSVSAGSGGMAAPAQSPLAARGSRAPSAKELGSPSVSDDRRPEPAAALRSRDFAEATHKSARTESESAAVAKAEARREDRDSLDIANRVEAEGGAPSSALPASSASAPRDNPPAGLGGTASGISARRPTSADIAPPAPQPATAPSAMPVPETQEGSVSLPALQGAARSARQLGHRPEEISKWKAVLAAGARGPARSEALAGLCEGKAGPGGRTEQEVFCGALLREFPHHPAAMKWKAEQGR